MDKFTYKCYYVCTVSCLRVLLNELHPVRASWYNIGLQLDIPHTELDCFEQAYSDPSDLLWEVLKHWDGTSLDFTWEAVVRALRSPIVDKKFIAEQLESKYCTSVPPGMVRFTNEPFVIIHVWRSFTRCAKVF